MCLGDPVSEKSSSFLTRVASNYCSTLEEAIAALSAWPQEHLSIVHPPKPGLTSIPTVGEAKELHRLVRALHSELANLPE
jgi:hypothetical protein